MIVSTDSLASKPLRAGLVPRILGLAAWVALPAIVVTLAGAWWLSQRLIVDTAVFDVTMPKLGVLLGLGGLGLMLLSAHRWRAGLDRGDVLRILPVGVLIAWLIVAAALRGSGSDLKVMLSFAVFAGGSFVVAFAAVRRGESATRVVVASVLVGTVVAFGGAALERILYPGPTGDPYASLWSFFRPQVELVDPRLGVVSPPPLHFPSGNPDAIRAAGFFAHPNYLAFFALLAAPLLAAGIVLAMRERRSGLAAAGAVLLAITITTGVWTYSRAGIAGMLLATALAVVVATAARSSSAGRRRAWMAPAAVVALVTVVSISVAVLPDTATAARITSIGAGAGQGETPSSPAPGSSPATVQETAAQSESIRLAMGRVALGMTTESIASLIRGPGLAAYETATHDPRSPLYVEAAAGIRDPNSMWLSFALAGGATAVILFAIVLALALLSAWRARARDPGGVAELASLWLLAWLPAWALTQLFGTYPFYAGEAVLLGTLVGVMLALRPSEDRMRAA